MRADSSIWEVHQPGKHYAYTTLAAARGFCDMAALAKKAGKAADVAHYAMLSQKVNTAFQSAFLDQQMALGGSIEGLSAQKYYDGSVAEAFDWNLLADFGGADRDGDARRCSTTCASTRAASSATTTG